MPPEPLTLADVDDDLLELLTTVAVEDAAADEVTPPLTPGHAWSAERIAWFAAYHRACRAGLDGPAGQQAWAVLLHRAPVGAVRLRRTGELGILETGIWLARTARGRRVGVAAMAAVADRARADGAHTLRADTDRTNAAARALLERCGYSASAGADGRVYATLDLRVEPLRE